MFNILVSNVELSNAIIFVNSFLNIMHIIIPILLIIIISFDMAKALISLEDDALVKSFKKAKICTIVCVLIFFIPLIINYFITNVYKTSDIDKNSYPKIMNGFDEVINTISVDTNDNSKTEQIANDFDKKINIDSTRLNTTLVKKSEITNTVKEMTDSIFKQQGFIDGIFNKKNLKDYCLSKECFVTYQNEKYNLYDNSYPNVEYESIGSIHVNESITNYLVDITLIDATINDNTYPNINLIYNLVMDNEQYKISFLNIEDNSNINKYLDDIEFNEKNKDIYNPGLYTTNLMNYDYTKIESFTSDDYRNIYDKNKNSIVMLNTYYNNTLINTATGIFISDGIILTTWSYIEESLNNGQNIIIRDMNGNIYDYEGLSTINYDLDLVTIKLKSFLSREVSISDSLPKVNDGVVVLSTKTGFGLSMSSGIVTKVGEYITSVIPITSSDIGSPLFNKEGYLIGLNTSNSLNSNYSESISYTYIKTIQDELKKTDFSKLKVITFKELKDKYFYREKNKELVINNVKEDIWNKYKDIGDIENSISLELVKANYYKGSLSLRYCNTITNYFDTFTFIGTFKDNLEDNGYNEVLNTDNKIVYKKGFNKVIIKKEFNYLIIVINKGGLL